MKRTALIVALPIIAITLSIIAMLLFASKVTEPNFDRIQIGMTQDQVEALIGTPDCELPHGGFVTSIVDTPEERGNHLIVNWNSRNAIIEVWFDGEGRVGFKRFWKGGDSFFDSIRRRLGLLKER